MSLNTDTLKLVNYIDYGSDIFAGLVKVKKITIGYPGNGTTDISFSSAADHTAQNEDVGAVIPANAIVLGVAVRCYQAVSDTSGTFDHMLIKVGNASDGDQFCTSTDLKVLNSVIGPASAGSPFEAISKNDQNVWVQGFPTPTAAETWSTMNGGKWELWIVYVDLNAIKE